MQITPELAQEIIHRLAKYLEVPVNIMDLDGKIVASTNTSRMEEIHSGAVKVIENEEGLILSNEEAKAFPGTRPGVNLPIIHRHQLAGVVGVTGDPRDVMQVAGMTRASVEIALDQIYVERKTFFIERQWNRWLQLLLHPSGIKEKELEEEAAYTLKVKTDKTWKVLVLRGYDVQSSLETIRQKMKVENVHPLFVLPFMDNEIVIAISGQTEGVKTMVEDILKLFDNRIKVGVGQTGSGVHGLRESYFQGKQALAFAKEEDNFAFIESWQMERLTASIPESEYNAVCQPYAQLLATLEEEYVKTIDTFLAKDFKVKETANLLHIHRNTLMYRLDQIKAKTGLDSRSFRDAFLLKVIRSRNG